MSLIQNNYDKKSTDRFSLEIVIVNLVVFSVGLLSIWVVSNADAQEPKKFTLNDTLVPIPEIILMPRQFCGEHDSVATDKMTLLKDCHVKVIVTVFAPAGTAVDLERYCESKTVTKKKDGEATASNVSTSTKTETVGKSGVFQSWRQLDPSAGGYCILKVKIGTKVEVFTVYGLK